MESIVKLVKEGNPLWGVAKDFRCHQLAVSKISYKYKTKGAVKKGIHARRPYKTSKCQDKKIKAICLQNIKCSTEQIKSK